LWNNYLQADVWVWWERVNYWRQQNSFTGLTGNEILPATLLYIFLPGLLVPVGWLNYGNYLPAAMLLNLAVLGLHLVLVKNRPLFLTSLMFFGPILLFRFDAAVTLLLLTAFWAFNRQKIPLSGLALGLATGIKVFPLIFLQYLTWLSRRRLLLLIYFAEGLILPALIFWLLGGSGDQIAAALSFHSLKLISIESLPGSMITGWSLLLQGEPPPLLAGYGIWAIPGPAGLFNWLWLVPVGLIYAGLFFCGRLKKFSWRVPLALILLFLVFSKNLNPQYLWWYMAFLPMLKLDRPVWLAACAAAGLNQLVYPLFYTQLIEDFYQSNRQHWVYYCLLLRNVAIVYLTWKILCPLLSETKGKLVKK